MRRSAFVAVVARDLRHLECAENSAVVIQVGLQDIVDVGLGEPVKAIYARILFATRKLEPVQ